MKVGERPPQNRNGPARAKTGGQSGVEKSGPTGKPRGRRSKRAQKRKELLDGATALFNARGISSTSLADVAEVLGLKRATVYYYVSDRAELVYQCYTHACETIAEDLAAASTAENGLERTVVFIRRALTPTRPPVAVLSEVNSLDPANAQIIRKAVDRNTSVLTSFITEGIQDGSVRPCDGTVVAQAITGMLAWAQLLPQWSQGNQAQTLRQRTADCIIGILTRGVWAARDDEANYRFSIIAESLQPNVTNFFDRKEFSSGKAEQILGTASRIFNRKGIEAASLDEIASAMGVTKGVLYHYYEDKTDLVSQCYQRSFNLYDHFVDLAKTEGHNGLHSAMINAHLNIQAQAGTLSPLMPQPGFEAVPVHIRAVLQQRARRQNMTIASMLKRGIEEGVARPCEAALATHVCAGAFGWLPKWLPDDRNYDPTDLADQICSIIMRGLNARTE